MNIPSSFKFMIHNHVQWQLKDYPELFIEKETGEVLETKLAEEVINYFDMPAEDEEVWTTVMDIIMPIAKHIEETTTNG